MASTYVNDLRLNEMATGDASGTWGTTTNTNLELIGEALGFGTEGITTNADTHTSTVADGATDPVRAMYVKYTGTLDSACTITIAPNTINRMQFIENGTSGSQNIIISQGSGANVTIPPGDTKAVYLDGAGSGAAVTDAFASLSVVDLKVQDDLTVTDDLIVNGDIDLEGSIDVNGTANLDVVDIDGAVDMATTLAVAGNVDFNGGLDVDGTTNLDVVDIDGAVNMSGSLTMSGSALIRTTDGTASLPGLRIGVDNDTGFYRPLANTIGFVTTGAERMRLDASGNVGINDTSPAALLTLKASANTYAGGFRIEGTDETTALGITHVNGDNFFSGNATDDHITLKGNGNVGIGTTNPGATLHVQMTHTSTDVTAANSNETLVLGNAGSGDGVYNAIKFGGNQQDMYIMSFNDNTQADRRMGFFLGSVAGDAVADERLSIRGDGKVGIGTTSPSSNVEISSSDDTRFQVTDTGDSSTFWIRGDGDNTSIGNTTNHPLAFIINNSERMRIDTSGNLLVGATSGSAHILSKSTASGGMLEIINSSTTAPSGAAFKFSHQNPNDGTSTFFTTNDSSAYRGGWLSNGGVQNYQANNSNLSDRREKTNFNPAKSYLDIICGIPVQTFNYIDQNMEDDDSPSLGVVAQDVQATAPELVVESNWGTKDVPKMRLAIYQTDFQYALMKCIQEQQTIIEDLKTRIETLEG